MIKSIAVFCSSSNFIAPKFFDIAQKIGELLVKNNYHLIYGGSAVGLMGKLAETVKINGGVVVGIIPEAISSKVPHIDNYDELIITNSMRERKAEIEKRADAFIALPGGFGTLEELIEIITLKQLQYHNKPIVILNAFGFYNYLLKHFEYLFTNSFANQQFKRLYHVVESPIAAITYFKQFSLSSIPIFGNFSL
ncbi:MAG: TIGR00730 family Rossman fold protein [Candidatus Lokiarchaeota archaeon]|nr:TIGR00730 family Rossman fold protein [Candidatus Harpocratesius repetitus]